MTPDLDAIVKQHEHALRLGKFGPKDLRRVLTETHNRGLEAAAQLLEQIYGPWDERLSGERNVRAGREQWAAMVRALKLRAEREEKP